MPGPVEGSTPRKITKRTHNKNPTFHSFHVLEALNYEEDNPLPEQNHLKVQSFFKKIARIQNNQESVLTKPIRKSNSNSKVELDSLELAEKQFATSKRNPLNYVHQNENSPSKLSMLVAGRSKSTNYLQQSPKALSFLNFKIDSQIRDKQLKGYNIITNLVRT